MASKASNDSSSPVAKRLRSSSSSLGSSGPSFVFGMFNSLDRLKQLVNNEYLADVTFKVGSTGQLIYAHKIFLTLASEVFFTQFNSGSFAESFGNGNVNPVVVTIEDIQPETFLTLMRYIYCDEVELTSKNVLEVYYAAQKYMLHQLNNRCRLFFASRIDELNALQLLDENRQHKFTTVDEKCLAIIRDNPIWFIKKNDLYSCSRRTMELIAASRTMNCHKQYLQSAIALWKKRNNDPSDDIIPKYEEMQCSKLASYSTSRYAPIIDTDLKISVQRRINLYGLDIYVGQETPNSASATLIIHIAGTTPGCCLSKTVTFKNKPYICQMMFEKEVVESHAQIRINVQKQNDVNMLCTEGFEPADKLPNEFLSVRSENAGYFNKNCIAYILYSN